MCGGGDLLAGGGQLQQGTPVWGGHWYVIQVTVLAPWYPSLIIHPPGDLVHHTMSPDKPLGSIS